MHASQCVQCRAPIEKESPVPDGHLEIYHPQVLEWEPPYEIPPAERVVVDRAKPVEEPMDELPVVAPPQWVDRNDDDPAPRSS
jgi:hypothetical protein